MIAKNQEMTPQERPAKSPRSSKREAGFDPDRIACACGNITFGELDSTLRENPGISYDDLVLRTPVGKGCTACLLDIEQFHTQYKGDAGILVKGARLGSRTTNISDLKRILYQALDRVSPLYATKTGGRMPFLANAHVRPVVWVSNESLLFKEKQVGPPVLLSIIQRDANGRVVSERKSVVAENTTEMVTIDLTDPMADGNDAAYMTGTIEIVRAGSRPGVRGTSRPHIEHVGKTSSSVVHFTGPTSPTKGSVAVPLRRNGQRVFLSVVSYDGAAMNIAIRQSMAGEIVSDESISLPGHGAILHELGQFDTDLPETGSVLVEWQADGRHKVHLAISDQDLTSVSIDHM